MEGRLKEGGGAGGGGKGPGVGVGEWAGVEGGEGREGRRGGIRAQRLCESRGGRSRLPVPNSPFCLCGRKATLKKKHSVRVQELCESRGGRSGLPVPNKPMVSVAVKQHSNNKWGVKQH